MSGSKLPKSAILPSFASFVLIISSILFNILFWIDKWSNSENNSHGIWELCFKEDYSCCQSFSDRDEHTPAWFNYFKIALYSACSSTAVTLILLPQWAVRDARNKKKRAAVLLISACFLSATCLTVASLVYSFKFKSIDILGDHKLHTSFRIAVACILLYSFAGILITVLTIKRRGSKESDSDSDDDDSGHLSYISRGY